jgi:hypothetical protein
MPKIKEFTFKDHKTYYVFELSRGTLIQGRVLNVLDNGYLLVGSESLPNVIWYQDIVKYQELISPAPLEHFIKKLGKKIAL